MKVNPLTRDVWRLLLAQGGWWTAEDLIGAKSNWVADLNQRRQVSHALRNFHHYGSCERRLPFGSRNYEYAITPACVVPLGITLKDILEAIHTPVAEVAA